MALGGVVLMDLASNHVEQSRAIERSFLRLPFAEKFLPQLVVVDVVEGTPASLKKGLERGNLIDTVNGSRVRSLADLRRVLGRAAPEDGFVVWKSRDGTTFAEETKSIVKTEGTQTIYEQKDTAVIELLRQNLS